MLELNKDRNLKVHGLLYRIRHYLIEYDKALPTGLGLLNLSQLGVNRIGCHFASYNMLQCYNKICSLHDPVQRKC
jgi:hypothetical protein